MILVICHLPVDFLVCILMYMTIAITLNAVTTNTAITMPATAPDDKPCLSPCKVPVK